MKLSNTKLPPDKEFGYFFAFVFIILGLYLYIFEKSQLGFLFFALFFLFLIISFLQPQLLRPLNKIWMMLGLILGMIVSPMVLGVIYFGLFTPISFLMKIFNRDELNLKNKNQETYWIENNKSSLEEDDFKKQF